MPLWGNRSVKTQWSTVDQLVESTTGARWMDELDQIRLAAYEKYDEIYWNQSEAFRLMRRGTEIQPIYVPNAMTIADETAHYLLKGFKLVGKDDVLEKTLNPWLRKSKFMSTFVVAKHSGVVRGDFVLHLVADPDEDEGKKVKFVDVDPSRYFPVTDPDDIDVITAVHLAEEFRDEDDRIRIRRLTYERVKVGGKWRIKVQEGVYETDARAWAADKPPLNRWIKAPTMLPESITNIPVYHFKNREWQGDEYGSSELRGLERIMAAVNQSISDNELALALEGLGVYATDAGAPIDSTTGKPTNWVIGPGQVMEIPTGSKFSRVQGISSIDPVLAHLKYLETHLMQASATANLAEIDPQTAQSGIALTVHFMPTLAKLEERETGAVDALLTMFEDWAVWYDEYEGETVDVSNLDVQLGQKLPTNRVEFMTELNNMLDRDVISRAEYRRQMEETLGYHFDPDIEQEIEEEQEELAKYKVAGAIPFPQQDPNATVEGGPVDDQGRPVSPTTGQVLMAGKNGTAPATKTTPKVNGSNNARKTNESNGTEPGQTGRAQQNVRPR